MMKIKSAFQIAVAIIFVVVPILSGSAPGLSGTGGSGDFMASSAYATNDPDSWILKWKDPESAEKLPATQVIRTQPETAVVIVRPEPAKDVQEWLHELRKIPNVEYVQPNEKVHLLSSTAGQEDSDASPQTLVRENSALPNDPELAKQTYLDQIGAKKAWETVREQTELTIAVIDTGVDLEHSDLKDNLVSGTNLVKPGKLPQDDNGHGTNVAGVIAAAGNNGEGTAGILWNARIMPVKALDADGYGDEDRLGEAILYAVKNKAKIIVLAVGLYRSSPYMMDIVQYAESKGVLLVAATGNDGLRLGSKAAVKYPAGYPTVLAVGGVTPGNKPEPRSNAGTEVDLAAPWNVFTTALGGGYKKEEGTSMAAPQVAAAAALVWARYPNLKPFQVRAMLRQTAKDIGPKGWDSASGYGLLQADGALTVPYKPDAAEPNDNRSGAYRLPLHTQTSGQLNGGADKDWFVVDVPFDGTLSIQFQGLTSPGEPLPPVRMTNYSGEQAKETIDIKIGSKTVDWKVSKGKNFIELQFDDAKQKGALSYLLTADFTIAPDEFEANDKTIEAFTLAPRKQTIAGTFHQTGDQDWYAVTFTQGGTLRLTMDTDTIRIDPAFAIGQAGEEMLEIDENGGPYAAETEESPLITVTPGKYYIKAYNASANDASPVVGTYKLKFDFVKVYEDPNEPNNKTYEATAVRTDSDYAGVIGQAGDEDWFQLRLTDEGIITFSLEDVPVNRTMTMSVYDKKQKRLFSAKSAEGKTRLTSDRKLDPGTYYIQLTSNATFSHQYYRFRVEAELLLGGFSDIKGHWAQQDIAALSGKGIVSGYGNYRFEPNRGITRAEAVTMLTRAFATAGKTVGKPPFKDVSAEHWASKAVAAALKAGWIKGYPNGTFKPGQLITRAEMAAMYGAAVQVKSNSPNPPPFIDVKRDDWAAPVLMGLKQRGLIKGYPGNTYKPDKNASRAEFTVLVSRAIP